MVYLKPFKYSCKSQNWNNLYENNRRGFDSEKTAAKMKLENNY